LIGIKLQLIITWQQIGGKDDIYQQEQSENYMINYGLLLRALKYYAILTRQYKIMRFILDIANKTDSKAEMKKIIDFLSNEIATIHCIDQTNENQFYDEQEKNILTEKQIRNYNNQMKNNNEPDIQWLTNQRIKFDFKTMLVMILSPLSCVLVWIFLLFLTSK